MRERNEQRPCEAAYPVRMMNSLQRMPVAGRLLRFVACNCIPALGGVDQVGCRRQYIDISMPLVPVIVPAPTI